MESFYTEENFVRVKLIFNPGSGADTDSPVQLIDVINELQAWRFVPEVYLIKPNCGLSHAISDAMERGIKLFIVSGGDGTVSSVARELCGKDAYLGIIPTGTQNNIAYSLGIPNEIKSACAIMRNGIRSRIDLAAATCAGSRTIFTEVATVGLLSTIFPSADEIQHGKLSKISDFLSTLVNTQPSEISIVTETGQRIKKTAHMLIIANMPFIIRHFQVGEEQAFTDGYLDLLLFANISKLELLGYAIGGQEIDKSSDPRIERLRAKKIEITASPQMPVMADGLDLGEGTVSIEVINSALDVIIPKTEKG